MACAETVWRTFIKAACTQPDNTYSIWHLAGILRPRETGKLSSKPSFRLLHDVITHLTWALVLECCARVIAPEFSSLEKFAASKPSWDKVKLLARKVALQYVAGDDFSAVRRKPAAGRDGVREDISLFLHKGLLYIDLGSTLR